MSLFAIRHGQASFGAAEYDQLSQLGMRQTRRLGDWLARHERFSHVVIGGMQRHRQSLDGIRAAFAEQGVALPEASVDPAFDEFDHRAVVSAYIAHHPHHPAVIASSADHRNQPKAVYALLRAAFQAWARGELDAATESWPEFAARTRSAGQRLHALTRTGPVLLVSSGGVIAQLAAAALELNDARAVELNLSLRNSALSEFVALPEGLRLSSWNTLPHLADDREAWSYL